jgi:drug/metabolite transporter (DMT)-like permease
MAGRCRTGGILLLDFPGRHATQYCLGTRHPVRIRYSVRLALALATVYVVWGSSFLFTKIAVNNLPLALFAGFRFTTAGILLALIARFCYGDRLPHRPIEWRHVIVTGFFMVLASNGLNTLALRSLPTNQAALLNGTAAFWIAGLGVFGPRGHPLTRWALLGLGIGFLGTALMLVPEGHLSSASLYAQVCVLTACLCWSLGTLYYRSIDTQLSPLMFMALQMFAGGLMLLCVALVDGDSAKWAPNPPGLLALGYLTFFSSCLAYTAYGWFTLNSTPALLGTYSYVNPAIASLLGWEFFHERLSGLQLIGMVVIIVGVCILTLPGGSLTDPKTLAEPKTQ